MICFFHSSDQDGFCSGAIVKRRYPECKMVGINYGDETDFSRIRSQEKVFMVDFSMPPDVMQRLDSHASLIWIDHHKTAIDKCSGMPIRGRRSIGTGACALVWQYLYPDTKLPEAVRLLAEYDVWNHSDPRTLPFQYGIRLEQTWPDKENMQMWNGLFDGGAYAKSAVESIIENGEIVLKYEAQSNELYMKSASFDLEWEGLTWLAANRLITNSKLFESKWDEEKYDGMLTFGWDGTGWRCSMYTSKKGIDVSGIAVKHGGGGHAQASGFKVDRLPFKLIKPETSWSK